MNLTVLENQVIVAVKAMEELSEGGIAKLSTDGSIKDLRGIVRAVGPGKQLDNKVIVPMNVKVGDNVMFPRKAGSIVKYDEVDYLIMSEDEIIAIM